MEEDEEMRRGIARHIRKKGTYRIVLRTREEYGKLCTGLPIVSRLYRVLVMNKVKVKVRSTIKPVLGWNGRDK